MPALFEDSTYIIADVLCSCEGKGLLALSEAFISTSPLNTAHGLCQGLAEKNHLIWKRNHQGMPSPSQPDLLGLPRMLFTVGPTSRIVSTVAVPKEGPEGDSGLLPRQEEIATNLMKGDVFPS